MLRFVLCSLLLIAVASAMSRYPRAVNQTEDINDSEASGLLTNGSDPIVARDQEGSGLARDQEGSGLARDQEGSGLLYDEEGSGSQLLFDSEHTNQTETTTKSTVFQQSIDISDSDVETLVLQVNLPQRNTSQLLDELEDDSVQQTNPIKTLDTAVSLTSMLNELLGRIQDDTNI